MPDDSGSFWNFGQPTSPGTDPTQLFNSAQGATKLGGAAQLSGSLLSSASSFLSNTYKAGVAAVNARIAMQNERSTLQAGERAETQSKIRTSALVGQMAVGQAANNVDVSSGSPLASRMGARISGDMDAAMIHWNAAQQARNFAIEAQQYHQERNFANISAIGDLVMAPINMFTSYLGTSSALASQSLSQQQAGG